MKTNYDELLPKAILYSLRTVEEIGLIKVDMMKKLIAKRELEIIKIGNKIHISRIELIRYLEKNTIEATN
ncbi:DNA-binding protein [Sulfuricurvum sp.]|uniref:DNA-binding protein n=1 Tax=Sulfuricurvum sp. TaxID=2025608 RepID=UPI003568DCF6